MPGLIPANNVKVVEGDHQVSYVLPTRGRRKSWPKKRLWIITGIIIVVVLIIIGAVVGGIIGSRNAHKGTSSSSGGPGATNTSLVSIGAYTFVGCQTEGNGVRTLPAALLANDNMTLEMCSQFCDSSNYAFFGAEYGRECKSDRRSSCHAFAD